VRCGCRSDDAEATLKAGLAFLEGLPTEETAAVRAELEQLQASIAAMRAQVSTPAAVPVRAPIVTPVAVSASPDPTPVLAAPAAAAPERVPVAEAKPAVATLSDEEQANLSRAKGRLSQARMLLASKRTDNASTALDGASK